MIIKTTWTNFINRVKYGYIYELYSPLIQRVNTINTLIKRKLGVSTDLLDPIVLVNILGKGVEMGCAPVSAPLYISSYSFTNLLPIIWLLSTLELSLSNYEKLLNLENGVEGSETETISTTNSSEGNSNNKSYNSNIPQVENVNDTMLDAFNFLSSADKQISNFSNSDEGTISRTKKNKSFKEELENFDLLYRNNLVMFYYNMFNYLYNTYSISCLPLEENIKSLFNNEIKEV